jgi:phage pi2 protein 07
MDYKEIKSFEDACKKLGIEPLLPDFSMIPEKSKNPMLAHYQLCIIVEAINGGWVPDWTDWSQYKYYAWFRMGSPSGSAFSYYDCDYWYTFSDAGSRLCFKTREMAEYAGKQFEQLYKEYFVIE